MDHKLSKSVTPVMDRKRKRVFLCQFLATILSLSAAFFISSTYLVAERFSGWGIVGVTKSPKCLILETQCRPDGSEALPKGIVSKVSDLEMRPLWGAPKKKSSTNLLAIAAGIKQKDSVNRIVKKFTANDFIVMLFHYDGVVNAWMDLEWSSHAIHVAAFNQTKWWFAKRFLHPDIVAQYAYIFLWDEDLGVDHFHVGRYLSIIKQEGLEISQPALDPDKSEVHHQITARQKNLRVHRRIYKSGPRGCDGNSTGPPCTGWVEMMAPVFSKTSWRCVWYFIQNDLVHAWGLDFLLGYCAQGNRTKNIGVVDDEYLIHYGIPTLGGLAANKTNTEGPDQASQKTKLSDSNQQVPPSHSPQTDNRNSVRRQSNIDLERFKNRWKKAIKEDSCWIDPFQ